MKHLKQSSICLLIIFTYTLAAAQKLPAPAQAQPGKPTLFRDIPSKVSVPASGLTGLLQLKKGQWVNLHLSDKISFEGYMLSTSSKYNNAIRSIVVKSTNLPGANLSFSAITNPDGTTYYRGRIISFQHGDCLELRTEKGQFYFEKKNLNDMVND